MIPPMLIATILVFVITTVVGVLIARRHAGSPMWLMALFVLSALPAVCYAGYYLHVVDEPILLYRLRALHGSELLAGLIGLPVGWLAARLGRSPIRVVRLSTFALAIAPMLLLIPYVKMTLSPLDQSYMKDLWIDGVCQQSTGSTCGPSSAATLLRSFGLPGDEATLAREAITTASGTEIWFLARALRARGLTVSFILTTPNPTTLPYPSIAGTQLGSQGGTGHFIAILGRDGDRYVIGDPLGGRRELVRGEELNAQRYFTGFFLLVGPRG
jgi:Peptidase C39 family